MRYIQYIYLTNRSRRIALITMYIFETIRIQNDEIKDQCLKNKIN